MTPDFYDRFFYALVVIANKTIFGMEIMKVLAIFVAIVLLYKSRFLSSFALKIFAIGMCLLVYFLPELTTSFIKIYRTWGWL